MYILNESENVPHLPRGFFFLFSSVAILVAINPLFTQHQLSLFFFFFFLQGFQCTDKAFIGTMIKLTTGFFSLFYKGLCRYLVFFVLFFPSVPSDTDVNGVFSMQSLPQSHASFPFAYATKKIVKIEIVHITDSILYRNITHLLWPFVEDKCACVTHITAACTVEWLL